MVSRCTFRCYLLISRKDESLTVTVYSLYQFTGRSLTGWNSDSCRPGINLTLAISLFTQFCVQLHSLLSRPDQFTKERHGLVPRTQVHERLLLNSVATQIFIIWPIISATFPLTHCSSFRMIVLHLLLVGRCSLP